MCDSARATGTHTLLISSENLENLLFSPGIALEMTDFLCDHGCEEIIYVLYIRRPGETFWSIYSELSRHTYVDPMNMLHLCLVNGYYAVPNYDRRTPIPPFWYFCFDHEKFVAEFEGRLTRGGASRCRLKVYDFDNRAFYPGEEMFRDIGLDPHGLALPPDTARNTRMPDDRVLDNYRRRFNADVPKTLREGFSGLVEKRHLAALERRSEISEMLDTRFGPGSRRLLARYGART